MSELRLAEGYEHKEFFGVIRPVAFVDLSSEIPLQILMAHFQVSVITRKGWDSRGGKTVLFKWVSDTNGLFQSLKFVVT